MAGIPRLESSEGGVPEARELGSQHLVRAGWRVLQAGEIFIKNKPPAEKATNFAGKTVCFGPERLSIDWRFGGVPRPRTM
jgi:hypothetical protein